MRLENSDYIDDRLFTDEDEMIFYEDIESYEIAFQLQQV